MARMETRFVYSSRLLRQVLYAPGFSWLHVIDDGLQGLKLCLRNEPEQELYVGF